ncbi:MAG: ATP-binding protein [Acidobacteriota bacterium]|nr:ATP-binding protein [Acidobacteriota bacterium]
MPPTDQLPSSSSRLPYRLRLALGIAAPLVMSIAVVALLPAVTGEGSPEVGHLVVAASVGALTAVFSHRWVRAPLRRLAAEARERVSIDSPSTHDDLDLLRQSFIRLHSRSEEQLSALTADREHLLAIVSSMSEGVLVVDRNGEAVIVNPRWRELFELPNSMEGATPIELTRQTRLQELVKRTLETGNGDQEEIDLDLPQPRTIIATSSALSDRSGAVVVARDITDFLRLAEVRRDFVANVSHELKTPLSAIRGLTETLHDGALEDRAAAEHFVIRILRQCERLEALLSDLLTLSRLEHPKSGIEHRSVDLGEVIRDAAEVLAAEAKAREVDVELSLRDTEPIDGDREALDRLLQNLLENAIKYNQPGGRVSVNVEQHDDQLVLHVRDTGIGIPADSLDRLFERFYRVDKGRSRDEGGTGLGLAIVKHATQLHGGRIVVESRLGTGSTFSVYLPLRT